MAVDATNNTTPVSSLVFSSVSLEEALFKAVGKAVGIYAIQRGLGIPRFVIVGIAGAFFVARGVETVDNFVQKIIPTIGDWSSSEIRKIRKIVHTLASHPYLYFTGSTTGYVGLRALFGKLTGVITSNPGVFIAASVIGCLGFKELVDSPQKEEEE